MTLDKELNMDFDGLVNESYEYLLEYQNTMHELDMKMIKCEHHCIVNENSDMMMLAEEEYKNNVTAALRTIWNKIVIKIQEFVLLINKYINKFRMRFKVSNALKQTAEYAIRMINDPSTYTTHGEVINKGKKSDFGLVDEVKTLKRFLSINIEILENPENFTNEVKKAIIDLKKLLENDFDSKKAQEIANNLKKYATEGSRGNGTAKQIVNAYEILQKDGYAEEWVRLLNEAKEIAKKQASLSNMMKDAKSTADATWFQRVINSCMFVIQKIITGCFKICYGVEAITTKTDTERRDKDEAERIEKIKKDHNTMMSNKDKEHQKEMSSKNREHKSSIKDKNKQLKTERDANFVYRTISELRKTRHLGDFMSTLFRSGISEMLLNKSNTHIDYEDVKEQVNEVFEKIARRHIDDLHKKATRISEGEKLKTVLRRCKEDFYNDYLQKAMRVDYLEVDRCENVKKYLDKKLGSD